MRRARAESKQRLSGFASAFFRNPQRALRQPCVANLRCEPASLFVVCWFCYLFLWNELVSIPMLIGPRKIGEKTTHGHLIPTCYLPQYVASPRCEPAFYTPRRASRVARCTLLRERGSAPKGLLTLRFVSHRKPASETLESRLFTDDLLID
jgi:hypothetical protein